MRTYKTNKSMTNLEKCNAGVEYSYADEELIALKTEAIRQCEIFNALDGRDYMAQYRQNACYFFANTNQ